MSRGRKLIVCLEERNKERNSWVFFAAGAKPTSMRRALAERMAERDPVVIVDQPVSLLRGKELPRFAEGRKRLSCMNGAWQYRPIHFPERLPVLGRVLKQLNQHLLRHELSQLLPESGKRIACYDSPTQYNLVKRLRENMSIYLAIDDRTITVWGKPIPGEIEAEKRLLSRVDRVVCISETLAEVLRSRVPKGRTLPIHVLPNGYNERIFDPEKNYPEPPDLARVSKPRVLVAGHISERIDWEDIRGAVKARPEWTWVFVGPADNGMKERINILSGRTFYHPPIPVEEVPAWIRHCDACAVPYRLNPFTMASSPLKAIEYLAMGAPVLSTRIPSLGCYDGAIEWVEEGDSETYAQALDALHKGIGNEELRMLRKRAVAKESWEEKANEFKSIVLSESSMTWNPVLARSVLTE